MKKCVILPFGRPAAKPEYRPDPRNGEVYATDSYLTRYSPDGEEIEMYDGFAFVHMSRSGDSASIERGFETLEEAKAAGLRRAMEINAVFCQ